MIDILLKYSRIGAKYLSFAYINLYDVLAILRELGYKTSEKIPPPIFRRGLGGSGPIATKGDVIVDVDTNRHVLGVSTQDLELLISEFSIIEEALSSRLRGYSRPQFYEAMIEFEVSVESVNFFSLINKMSNLPLVTAVSKTLGVDAGLIGLRIGLKDARPEDDEWMDIEIMPSMLKTDNILYVSVLLRSREKEKVYETIRKVAPLSSMLINSLLRK